MPEKLLRKRKRYLRCFSAAVKLQAIERVLNGESKSSVGRDMGVPESTLRGWCKDEEKIRRSYFAAMRNSRMSDEMHSPASSTSTGTICNLSIDDEAETLCPRKKRKLDLQTTVKEVDCDELSVAETLLSLSQSIVAFPSPMASMSPMLQQPHQQQPHQQQPHQQQPHHQEPHHQEPQQQQQQQQRQLQPQRTTTGPVNNTQNNNDNSRWSINGLSHGVTDSDVEAEAIKHADIFFKWLNKCGEPSVTRFQLLRFKSLLDSLDTIGNKQKIDQILE